MRVAMPTVGRRMTKSVDSAGQNDKLSELMDLVKGMTIKQRQLEAVPVYCQENLMAVLI